MQQGRHFWDATAVFEALASADVVLWGWEPGRDRLRITGSARNLGLGPLAPECAAAAGAARSGTAISRTSSGQSALPSCVTVTFWLGRSSFVPFVSF